MQVTLTQDAIIDGRRFEAGAREMTEAEAESARALGVVADAETETAEPEPQEPEPQEPETQEPETQGSQANKKGKKAASGKGEADT